MTKIAFVFPGQGSQSVGMLSDLAKAYPAVQDVFAEASEVLDYDLWNIVQNGPDAELNNTAVTQPAMLAAGAAVWRLWQAKNGGTPALMAGHSLGEYTALVCAGALDFKQAVKLVAQRGQFMQEAVPAGQGAMAAILGLDDDTVIKICVAAAQGDTVAAVNFNSPGQVVVAGTVAAVERAVDLAKQTGAKRAVVLPVSVPSHCALMKPAAQKLAEQLERVSIQSPRIPVINNVNVSMETDSQAIRTALVSQLYSPVRWVEIVQKMADEGVQRLVECGPGKVLVGLNRRITRDMQTNAVFDPASLEQALTDTKG
jgi:[acyl-carrier-protein] S-malonyltransferase